MLTTPSHLAAEVENILRDDIAARAAVENRYLKTRRRRQYNPTIETAPRLVASLAEQNIDELRLDYKHFANTVKCSVAGCNERAVDCHQASRSNQLKHIRDKGMVWWFDKFRNGYIGAGGPQVIDARHAAVPQPSRVGAKKATTFRGFCGTHDRDIFALVDGDRLTNTRDQLLRLMYRAASYEAYWKRWDSSPTKQAVDRMTVDKIITAVWPGDGEGREGPVSEDRKKSIITNTLLQQARDRLICRALDKWLTWIELRLSKAEETDVRAIEFRVTGRPFLACSGLVSAVYDFAGSKTVDDIDPSGHEGIAVMTTWFHSAKEWSLLLIEAGATSRRIDQYVKSLKAMYDQSKWLERLTTWMMVSCGNVAMSPGWWRQIGDYNQMMSGVIFQQHHGDGRTDLTNEYWKDSFVGEPRIEMRYHW